MTQLRKRPVVLIIRDGWGKNPYSKWDEANATIKGKTPVDEMLTKTYPNVLIKTSGEDVGLPDGVMGNSEVGHQNIGAGRIVNQEIMRITSTIRDGSFFKNEVFLGALDHARKNNGSLHIMGLVSDGRVHSDLEHCKALLELCKKESFDGDKVFVHAITDGRDTSPKGGKAFVQQIQDKIDELKVGRIASVVGRYYAMDRDFRWDRVQEAYDLLTKGSADVYKSADEAIQEYYDKPSEASRTGDEFIKARSISPSGRIEDEQKIKAGDAVIFFNYRGDRPRELCKAFVYNEDDWKKIQGDGFDRGEKIENLYFVGMSNYEKGLPIKVAIDKPPKMPSILGQVVSEKGLKQFRCAETEKFPHVTFFFNDYREDPFDGEDRKMAQSPKHVTTYDQAPEMAAKEVTQYVLDALDTDLYDMMVVNYANGDMVGHTGSLEAAVTAVETVDTCVGQIVEAVTKKGGALVVTADHGNCEQMVDPETGGPHTAHTTYDVNLIVVDEDLKGKKLKDSGRLADIAPTVLKLMGLEIPEAMTGDTLF